LFQPRHRYRLQIPHPKSYREMKTAGAKKLRFIVRWEKKR
jgi:hypothetical protein